MDIQIKIMITDPDGVSHEHRFAPFQKGYDQSGDIGLSIEEGKTILLDLQTQIVTAQAQAIAEKASRCAHCQKALRSKGSKSVNYRTVFGDISVDSRRFYHCQCSPTQAKTFSPLTSIIVDHVSPELLWLEAKWASLVSFGVTVKLLHDVLPIGKQLTAETIRRHHGRVATRLENELADERYSYIATSASARSQLPNPEGPITIGIDGGYVKSREEGQTHFEVTVGKSIPTDRRDRYLGLVTSYDKKPRRRLHDVLREQGWRENQPVTFMTDGGDNVINMARDMAPALEHLLDWFHITMRITVMGQYVKGLAHHNLQDADKVASLLRQIKGFLWNGNTWEAQMAIDDLVDETDSVETQYPSIKGLRKATNEFQTYIINNAWMIPNYAERRRYGERVSTGFVESTVNTMVGKRFCKSQQMRWSKRGAHLMLQTRARTLDGTLRQKFEDWHPGMKATPVLKLAA
jgi:hypothetical protein